MTQPSYQLHTHNGWALSAGAGLTRVVNPALLGARGVGAETAAALLVAAGDNPDRMRSEASFAALCGTNPSPGSPQPPTLTTGHTNTNQHTHNPLMCPPLVGLRLWESGGFGLLLAASVMGVSTPVGQTQLTRIPDGPSSTAACRVSPTTPTWTRRRH